MTDPLASVIILGWGGERYIEACLRELGHQSYSALETFVVDNDSTGRTAEIVESSFPKSGSYAQTITPEGNNAGLRAA